MQCVRCVPYTGRTSALNSTTHYLLSLRLLPDEQAAYQFNSAYRHPISGSCPRSVCGQASLILLPTIDRNPFLMPYTRSRHLSRTLLSWTAQKDVTQLLNFLEYLSVTDSCAAYNGLIANKRTVSHTIELICSMMKKDYNQCRVMRKGWPS